MANTIPRINKRCMLSSVRLTSRRDPALLRVTAHEVRLGTPPRRTFRRRLKLADERTRTDRVSPYAGAHSEVWLQGNWEIAAATAGTRSWCCNRAQARL